MIQKLKAFICVWMLFPAAAYAEESMKEKAERICRAYIEEPAAFKEITLTYDCKFSLYPNEKPTDRKCFDFQTSDKAKMTFGFADSGGSCRGRHIGKVSSDGAFKFLETINVDVNGYGFGGHDSAFEYNGDLVLSYGGDLRLVSGEGGVILCSFLHQWQAWEPVQPEDSNICEQFQERAYEVIGKSIPENEWDSWPKHPEARPQEVYSSDLNRDDISEQIVRYDYASGAGCGCDAHILAMVKDNQILSSVRGRKLFEGQLTAAEQELSEALQKLWSCDGGEPFTIVRISGKNYILTNYGDPESKVADMPPLLHKLPERALYEYHKGSFKKICSQSSRGQKRISHEVYPKSQWWRLDYKPL